MGQRDDPQAPGGARPCACWAKVPLSGITYVVRVSGDGTAEQFERLRQTAQVHCPNVMSLATAVAVNGSVPVI